MLIYATPTDLAAWTGTAAPANATQLLRSASLLVQEATNNAYYDTPPDTSGGQSSGSYNYYRPDALPSDPAVAAVLNEATCIQAAAWAALGIDPTLAGVVKPSVASQKLVAVAASTDGMPGFCPMGTGRAPDARTPRGATVRRAGPRTPRGATYSAPPFSTHCRARWAPWHGFRTSSTLKTNGYR